MWPRGKKRWIETWPLSCSPVASVSRRNSCLQPRSASLRSGQPGFIRPRTKEVSSLLLTRERGALCHFRESHARSAQSDRGLRSAWSAATGTRGTEGERSRFPEIPETDDVHGSRHALSAGLRYDHMFGRTDRSEQMSWDEPSSRALTRALDVPETNGLSLSTRVRMYRQARTHARWTRVESRNTSRLIKTDQDGWPRTYESSHWFSPGNLGIASKSRPRNSDEKSDENERLEILEYWHYWRWLTSSSRSSLGKEETAVSC